MPIHSLTDTIAKNYYSTSRSTDRQLTQLNAAGEAQLQRNAQNFLVGLKQNVDRAGTLQPGLFASRNEGTAAADDILKFNRQRCLDNSQQNRPALLKAIGHYTDEEPEIVANRLSELLPRSGRITINLRAQDFNVHAFVRNGGLLNAHAKDTRTQGGSARTDDSYMFIRKATEQEMFELEEVARTSAFGNRIRFISTKNPLKPNPDFSAFSMPCYGAFSLDGDPELPAATYGGSKITLKRDVLSRCVMTAGDSFNAEPYELCSSDTMPDLVLHAHRNRRTALGARLVQMAGVPTKHPSKPGRDRTYIDTQIFGGVNQDDIERVDLDRNELLERFPSETDFNAFVGQLQAINENRQADGQLPVFFL